MKPKWIKFLVIKRQGKVDAYYVCRGCKEKCVAVSVKPTKCPKEGYLIWGRDPTFPSTNT